MKSLIIYFSRADENYFGGSLRYINKGNTEIIAEFIKDIVDGDIFKVEREKDYSSSYMQCIKEAQIEQNNNERPQLKKYIKDIKDYDVIFIGSPIYWGTMAQPLFSQLELLDFKGKTIMPFTTHEGSGLANVVKDIKTIAKGADIKPGLAIVGSKVNSAKAQVEKWIRDNLAL